MQYGQFATVQGADYSSQQITGAGNLQVGNLCSAKDAASGEAAFSDNSESLTITNSAKRTHTSGEIDIPPNKKSTTSDSTQYNIPVGNRYAVLENLSDQDKRFEFANVTPPQEDENLRIPPIYVNNIYNISEFNKEIKSKLTSQFTTDFNGNRIKIMFKSIADFRTAIKYLIETKRQFHTYKDPANKKFSVVFKNIHPTITLEEITEDLQHKFPSIISVTRLYKNNVPIPVIAAEFNGSQNIEQVLQINQICNISVKPERRRRPKGPVQCMRCLDFGHTKNNCNNSIACIFCAQDHYSVNCPKKDLPAVCKNCNGSHRADLRSIECPYYKKQIDTPSSNSKSGNIKNRLRNNPPPRLTSQNFPSLPTSNNIPNFTFAPNPPQNTNQNNRPNNNPSTHPPLINNSNNNSFIHSIINSITCFLVNIINNIIPTIVSNLQASLSAYFNNNNATVP